MVQGKGKISHRRIRKTRRKIGNNLCQYLWPWIFSLNLWVSYITYTHQITIHAIYIFFLCEILSMHNPTFGLRAVFHLSSLHLSFCSLLETISLFCFIELMITLTNMLIGFACISFTQLWINSLPPNSNMMVH